MSCSSHWPGYRILFTTRYALSPLIPFNSVKYIYREAFGAWKDKHGEFAKYGIDIISGVRRRYHYCYLMTAYESQASCSPTYRCSLTRGRCFCHQGSVDGQGFWNSPLLMKPYFIPAYNFTAFPFHETVQ